MSTEDKITNSAAHSNARRHRWRRSNVTRFVRVMELLVPGTSTTTRVLLRSQLVERIMALDEEQPFRPAAPHKQAPGTINSDGKRRVRPDRASELAESLNDSTERRKEILLFTRLSSH